MISFLDGLKHYGGTPEFTAETVPQKLLSTHSLKAGTWGRMRVRAGCVNYYLEGEELPLKTVTPAHDHIIPPEECHFITVSADAIFQIEFWK